MSKNWKRLLGVLIGILIVIMISFNFGYNYAIKNIKPKMDYITLPPIHDSIRVPYPVEVEVPGEPQWLTKWDTCYVDSSKTQVIDTLAILSDWISKRRYTPTLFDSDSIGKLDIDLIVQYNKLQSLKYKYYPIQKTVTTTPVINEKLFQPYVIGGFNTDYMTSIGAGLWIKHLGIQYEFQFGNSKSLNQFNTIHGLKLGYKF